MLMLVLEVFAIMALFVAMGLAGGVAARRMAEARAVRADAASVRLAPDLADPEPGPGAYDMPAGDFDAAAADAVIDPDRAAAADEVGIRPEALAHPRDGLADDLRQIRGLGAQSEARLAALGIFHLDQIAAWSSDEVRWVSAYLGIPGRIAREDWPGQARALLGFDPAP